MNKKEIGRSCMSCPMRRPGIRANAPPLSCFGQPITPNVRPCLQRKHALPITRSFRLEEALL